MDVALVWVNQVNLVYLVLICVIIVIRVLVIFSSASFLNNLL